MIIEQLIKRPARERRIMVFALLVVVGIVGYLSVVAPAVESLNGVESDLATTQSGLDFQERQLKSLRAETEASQKIVAEFKDMACPWIAAGKADSIMQEFQKEAASLGLTVKSMVRERAGGLKLKDPKVPVSALMVRLDVAGPYTGVVELLRRLNKRSIAVGVDDLSIRGLDEPPFEVDVSILMKIPVAEGGKNG